jgi:hypothetical protein
MSYLASEIMDGVAALMNDVAQQRYSYSAQIPYLNIALTDLREELQLSNSPVSNEESAVIVIAAGVTELDFTTTPPLPTGLMEIQQAWYRQTGTSDAFLPMQRVEFLPHYLQATPSQFQVVQIWSWQEPKMKFIAAIGSTEMKLDYVKTLFPIITSPTDAIAVLNGKSFLQYKTAALCAKYIGENPSRSDELNALATIGLDRSIGISTKGRQSITTRRRPFRQAFKSSYGVYR